MAVSIEEARNFCYVLPTETPSDNINDIMLVVPNSLQIGWTESPPCFCAGTDTSRDLMDIMLPLADELEVHNSEPKMEPAEGGRPKVPPPPPKKAKETNDMSMSSDEEETTPMKTIFEVFMDDFMAMTK